MTRSLFGSGAVIAFGKRVFLFLAARILVKDIVSDPFLRLLGRYVLVPAAALYALGLLDPALVWLEGQPRAVRESASTEIWVTDWRNGDWIDARAATYVSGRITPMEYGLGAQSQPVDGGLGFAQAKERIFEVERRFDIHGAHLDEAAAGGSERKAR